MWPWLTGRCKLLQMKRFVILLAVLPTTLLAGKSDPGAPFIAADEAYDKDIQANGEWAAAFRLALPQSETFVPQRVKVLELGKGRSAPPPRRIKPEHAWVSCDGTVGVTVGSWRLPDTSYQGWYESIWVKMEDGSYKILLRRAQTKGPKLYSQPGRKGMRAACTGKAPPLPIVAPDVGTDFKMGASHDQTLIWSSAVSAKGAVRIVISIWNGKTFDPVLEDVALPPAPR